jgi:peroxiredoxin
MIGSLGASAAAQDANEILRRSADLYRSLHSVETSGVLTAHLDRLEIDYDVRWPVSTAQADSTLLPADSPAPALAPLLRFGKVEFRDAAGNPTAPPDPGVPSPKGWSLFDQIDQGAREVTRLPDGTVEFGGNAVTCRVLEVNYEPGFPSRALSRHPIRYWIDPSSSAVLAVSFALQARGGEIIHWTYTAHELKTNEPPPRWALQALPQLAGQEREDWLGRQAPAFELTALDGRQVSLSSLRGKAVVLSFWASWCAPCKEEMPLLEELRAEWEPAGVEVWGITNESAAKTRAWLDEHEFDLPTLVDDQRRVFQSYEADQIPVSVVLDREGKVVSYLQGLGGKPYFRAAIERALAEPSASPGTDTHPQ